MSVSHAAPCMAFYNIKTEAHEDPTLSLLRGKELVLQDNLRGLSIPRFIFTMVHIKSAVDVVCEAQFSSADIYAVFYMILYDIE